MLDKCSNVKRMKSGKFKITKKKQKKQIKMLKNQLNSIKQLSPHVQTMLKQPMPMLAVENKCAIIYQQQKEQLL